MLSTLLTNEVTAFFTLFVRIGAALIFMPAFGESFVNPRSRLAIALALTVVVHPVLAPRLPALPENVWMLGLFYAGEAGVGFFLGLTARAVMSEYAAIFFRRNLSLARLSSSLSGSAEIVSKSVAISGP